MDTRLSDNIEKVVKAVSRLITSGRDWGALYMLLCEREDDWPASWLAAQIGLYAPEGVPKPSRQTIEQGAWYANGRRFPDWKYERQMSYQRFRRHYAIARAALKAIGEW